MSRRFKTSKYKNAAPKVSKHEPWVRDLTIASYNCSGSFVKASSAFVAFNIQVTGSQLGVVPLDSEASYTGTTLPVLNAHSDLVTDFEFSPFEDGLLATCSADSTVKIWSFNGDNLKDLSTLSPECVTSSKMRRVENVSFNPVADYLVCYTSQSAVTLWDILYNKELYYDNEMHDGTILSMSWSRTGNAIATCAKDKRVRVVDPRARRVVVSAVSHDNPKDSRVIWTGEHHILTTGFDSSRIRQVFVRDTRNFSSPVKTLNFDSSTGILMPLYDADTNMLFLAGRGDTSISYMEFSESEPFLTEGFRYNGEQTKGACLVPKRALKVMDTEVNRIIQLTANSIIPIPYHVPRKTYMDFHGDLFPDTRGTVTSGTASLWMGGFNGAVTKISLNPTAQSSKPVFKASLANRRKEEESKISKMIEPDPESYRKEVPEARPRKKSLTGSGMAEDFADGTGKFAPVPRPRVNNPANVSCLRTPSSFLGKRNSGSDYTRAISMDENETESCLQQQDFPREIAQNSINNNHHDEETKANSNGHTSNGVHNGNGQIDTTEGPQLSTTDRRKAFEARSLSTPAVAEDNARKPKMSVADRLKMFQNHNIPENNKEENQNFVTNKIVEKDIGDNKDCVRKCPEKPARKISGKMDPPVKSENVPAPTKAPAKRIDTVFGQVSKYRNFKAAPLHKKFHIENLRNVSTTCPGESELIQGNTERVAVPLNTPGGKVAIFELSKPGRQPDGVIPALVHGTKVMDFMWDPFDNERLAVGTDDGKLWLWRIPSGGLVEQTNQPEWSTAGHAEKIYFVRFHPLAQDVLATGSYDLSIRIWDLAIQQDIIIVHLPAEQIQIFSFSWSLCGSKFATACKDGKVRVYEPRKTTDPIVLGKGPPGVRGGRVTWVLDGKFLIVAGFDRSSERQLHMYNSSTMENVATVSLDVSPAILVPFYDEDSSILFLSGRGDSTIFAFDVMSYSPHLRALTHHRCPGPHQGICFLKKNACDVQSVEFARALRLTEVSVEIWGFTVPRVKSEFFQDDLFPPTRVLWEPTMTSREWFAGSNDEPYRISLKPSNMKSLTETSGSNSARSSAEPELPKHGKQGNPVVTQNLSNTEAKNQQKKVEQALRERFNLNFDVSQELIPDGEDADWNE